MSGSESTSVRNTVVIALAVAVFGTIGVLRACPADAPPPQQQNQAANTPPSGDSAPAATGPYAGISRFHPHHPGGPCKEFFYPPDQPGYVYQRGFDGRVPKWKMAGDKIYKKEYDLEELGTFAPNVAVWTELLSSFAGKPNVSYLEIGVWEGGSALWMLENILTDPSSKATVIDIMMSKRWEENIKRSGRADSIKTIIGPSQTVLRDMKGEQFDIVYIDGSHWADDTLTDAVLAFALLKPNGVMIFDDYCLDGSDFGPDQQALPLEELPKPAIDAFLLAYGHRFELIHRYYQVAIRKRPQLKCEKPTGNCLFLPMIAGWTYHWNNPVLENPYTKGSVELTEAEHRLFQRILRTTDLGSPGFHPTPEMMADPAYAAIEAKLKTKLSSAR